MMKLCLFESCVTYLFIHSSVYFQVVWILLRIPVWLRLTVVT